MDMTWAHILPLVFMGVMGLALLAYVVLDGYDLGVGILLPFATDEEKDVMVSSIGPFWDANETWLVLGVGLLLIAFPRAHGVILGALYLPVAAMLIGLILRGVAFDFRVKAHDEHKPIWDFAFWSGSLLAALAQGFMLGQYILGFRSDVVALLFAACIAFGLCAGYALLGASWLIMKTDDELVRRAVRWALRALWLTGLGIALVSIVTPAVSPRIFAKWFALPNLFLLLPIPVLTALAFAWCDSALRRMARGDHAKPWAPFVAAVLMFVLAFAGLTYSLFPYLVMDQITAWDAAAAPASLKFIGIGVMITLPVIVGYTIIAYRVFWGRSTALSYE
jgi:cytochrome d ubiquinol oxidase subunit II